MKIEPFYAQLGARIRMERERAGKTQADLGDALGLTRASVANMESAQQRILAHQLPQIAEALGCEVARLFMPSVFRKRRTKRHEHTFFTDEDGACHPCQRGEPYPGLRKDPR